MPCTFCDIHPLSGINKFEKVSLFTDHSNIRIWDGHFQEFSSGKIEKDEIISTDEKETILHNLFGL